MLALWDWEGNQHEPLVEYPGGKEEIFGVRFAPHTNAEFVSYGVKHLRLGFRRLWISLGGKKHKPCLSRDVCACFMPDWLLCISCPCVCLPP